MAGVEQGLGVPRKEVLPRIDKLRAALEEAEKENRALRRKLAREQLRRKRATMSGRSRASPCMVRKVEGLDMTELRDLADSLKQKLGSGVVILGSAQGSKAFLVVSVTKDLTSRVQAGAVIRELAPLVGGGGGGRPDFAQAGGSDPAALDGALAESPALVEKLARE